LQKINPAALLGEASDWQILLKKSFSPDKRKVLGPLMRFARGDVRDHIISGKNNHRPAYRRHGALQR